MAKFFEGEKLNKLTENRAKDMKAGKPFLNSRHFHASVGAAKSSALKKKTGRGPICADRSCSNKSHGHSWMK